MKLVLLLLMEVSFSMAYPDLALVRAVETALIKDNLIALQSTFYPSTGLPPNQVYLDIDYCIITVQNISEQAQNKTPVFVTCSDLRCGKDLHCLHGDYSLTLFANYKSNYYDLVGYQSFLGFDALSNILYSSLSVIDNTDNSTSLRLSLLLMNYKQCLHQKIFMML